MSRRSSSRKNTKKRYFLQKPNGQISDRVQAVGGDRFGIVAVDCAKKRSCFILANFFGNVFIEPTSMTHSRGGFQSAVDHIRQVSQQQGLRALLAHHA